MLVGDDRDVVFAAVKRHSQTFKFASTRLRDDMEFVSEASQLYGRILVYASERLSKDENLIAKSDKVKERIERENNKDKDDEHVTGSCATDEYLW